MAITQISVFLENRPGTLFEAISAITDAGVNMRALSVAETKDFGIARLIVDDALEAVNTLKENDFVASLTPVLAIEIPDEAGGLDKLLEIFADAEVNIEYMYAFPGGRAVDKAVMIFRVADTKASEARLTGKGLRVLSQEDIAQI